MQPTEEAVHVCSVEETEVVQRVACVAEFKVTRAVFVGIITRFHRSNKTSAPMLWHVLTLQDNTSGLEIMWDDDGEAYFSPENILACRLHIEAGGVTDVGPALSHDYGSLCDYLVKRLTKG